MPIHTHEAVCVQDTRLFDRMLASTDKAIELEARDVHDHVRSVDPHTKGDGDAH